jgi:DNA-binding NarL/FixJ family response regulator
MSFVGTSRHADARIDSPVTLVIAGHPALRHALCERIRASFPSMHVRDAGTLDLALCVLATEPVDIVVVDTDANRVDTLRITRAVLDCSPRSSVIVLAGHAERGYDKAAGRSGALAFINRRAVNTEFVETLARLAEDARAAHAA